MTISAVNNNSSTSSSSSSKNSTEMTQFLNILLTQLKTQSPLDPMKPSEFTSQIAQYSSLEQQMNTNTKLDSLMEAIYASSISPISFLGNTVDFESATSISQDGKVKWTYSVDGASSVMVKITDANGSVVYEGPGSTAGGTQEFSWDAPEGSEGKAYKIEVTAKDEAGSAIDTVVAARVRVDAVDSSSGELMLEASGYQFKSSLVSRVATPAKITTAQA